VQAATCERLVKIVILGAGGHGREALDTIRAALAAAAEPDEVLGFLDDQEVSLETIGRLGLPYLGPVVALKDLDARFVIGIGLPRTRRRVDELAMSWEKATRSIVHPSATIGTDVVVGEGALIAAGARVSTHCWIGRQVYIGPNVTVGHDCVLENYATLLPGANVSGNVRLGAETLIGAGATIRQGVAIGDAATVGMGAAVLNDVDAASVVVGVPARVQRRDG